MKTLTLLKPLSLDFVNSDDPAVLDQGIRDTIKSVRTSVLAAGIALARIKNEKLFKKLEFKNMTRYMSCLCKDIRMDRSSLYVWLCIGEVYLKYQNDLEKIGFCDSDSPTKLPYLERALSTGDRQEVFHNLINMDKDEFVDYVKSGEARKTADAPFLEIRGNTIYLNGETAIVVSKNLGEENTAFFMELAKVAGRALEKGGVVLAVHLRNWKELEAFKMEALKIREEIQKRDGKKSKKPKVGSLPQRP